MSFVDTINALQSQLSSLQSHSLLATLDCFSQHFNCEQTHDVEKIKQLINEKKTHYLESKQAHDQEALNSTLENLFEILNTLANLQRIEQAEQAHRQLSLLVKDKKKIQSHIKALPTLDESALETHFLPVEDYHHQQKIKACTLEDASLIPKECHSTESQRTDFLKQCKIHLIVEKTELEFSKANLELVKTIKSTQQKLRELAQHLTLPESPEDSDILSVYQHAQDCEPKIRKELQLLQHDLESLSVYAASRVYPNRLIALKEDRTQLGLEKIGLDVAIAQIQSKQIVCSELDQKISEDATTPLNQILSDYRQHLNSQLSTDWSHYMNPTHWLQWGTDKNYNEQTQRKDALIKEKLGYLSLREKSHLNAQQISANEKQQVEATTMITCHNDEQNHLQPAQCLKDLHERLNSCLLLLDSQHTSELNSQLTDITLEQDDWALKAIGFVRAATESLMRKLDTNLSTQELAKEISMLFLKEKQFRSQHNMNQSSSRLFQNKEYIEEQQQRQADNEIKLAVINEQLDHIAAYHEIMTSFKEHQATKDSLRKDLKLATKALHQHQDETRPYRNEFSIDECQIARQHHDSLLSSQIKALQPIPQQSALIEKLPALPVQIIDVPASQSMLIIEEEGLSYQDELIEQLRRHVMPAPEIEASSLIWYQALTNSALAWFSQADLSDAGCEIQAFQIINCFFDLKEDIESTVTRNDYGILKDYQAITGTTYPLNFNNLLCLCSLKPQFLIEPILQADMPPLPDKQNPFNAAIRDLQHAIVDMKHDELLTHPVGLVEKACKIVNHVGHQALQSNDFSASLKGLKKDPHYKPLTDHPTLWQKFKEVIDTACRELLAFFVKTAPQQTRDVTTHARESFIALMNSVPRTQGALLNDEPLALNKTT